MRTSSLALIALALVACGDDTAPLDAAVDAPLDGGFDAASDAASADAGGPADAAPDAHDAGPRDCASILAPTAPFALAPEFRRAQIHPAAAFDGEHVWVALTVAEEPGPANACVGDDTSSCAAGQRCVDGTCRFSGFDIALVRVDCDGSPRPPQIVAGGPASDLDAAIAVGRERLLLAWQRDEGTGSIGTVTLATDLDGAPLGEETPYVSLRGGAPVTGTVWLPSLTARPDGGFWLYGTRGVEEVGTFLAYLQALDADGVAVGEGADFFPAAAQQDGPALALDGDAVHLGWTQEDQARYLAPGATEPATLVEGFVATALGHLAQHGDRTLAAVTAGLANPRLLLLDTADAANAVEIARGAGPWIAPGETSRGAVLWLEGVRGFVAERLLVRPYEVGDTGLVLGAPVEAPTLGDVGLPYRPSVIHVRGDTYFVSWSERVGDRWDAFGQLVEL